MTTSGQGPRELERLRARAAWRAASIATGLTVIGMPIDLAIVHRIPGVPMWPDIAAMVGGLALWILLLVRRRRATRWLGNAVFLLDLLFIVGAISITNQAFAESGRLWVPFQTNKLGMVAVALLAPELWLGLAGIGAYAAAAVVQQLSFSDEMTGRMAAGEPWATIAFAVFSVVLLATRLRQFALEREVARAHAEILAAQKFAKVLLAVRDLSNTPLQTITLAAATVRARHPDLEPTVARVERALDRLRDLDRRLPEHGADLEWTSDEESFDARKALDPLEPPPSAQD